jgi:cytoskeletal protein RodZ
MIAASSRSNCNSVDYADFGRYLAQQRELRGVSRMEVSTATKIPLNLLAALENGERERLPEKVFIVNYIRAYAQVIGLAEEEAVLRFEEVDKATQPSQAVPAKPGARPTRTDWIAVLVAILVLVLVLMMKRASFPHWLWGR